MSKEVVRLVGGASVVDDTTGLDTAYVVTSSQKKGRNSCTYALHRLLFVRGRSLKVCVCVVLPLIPASPMPGHAC